MLRSREKSTSPGFDAGKLLCLCLPGKGGRISKERAVWYCSNSSSLEPQYCFLTAQACLIPFPESAQFQEHLLMPTLSQTYDGPGAPEVSKT